MAAFGVGGIVTTVPAREGTGGGLREEAERRQQDGASGRPSSQHLFGLSEKTL